MLRRIRSYVPQVAASVVLTVVFSLLSSISVVMTMPILRALFSAPDQGVPAAGVEDVIGLKTRLDHLYAHFEGWLLSGSQTEALQRVVVVLFGVIAIRNLAQYLGNVLMAWVGLNVVKDLREDVFAKFLQLPFSFYHRFRAGELISRATNDVEIANKTVNVSFTNLFRDPVLILAYLGTCLWISAKLTLLALVVLPVSLFVILKVGQHLRRYSHRQQERLADLTSVLQETVYGIRVVKAFAMERFELKRFVHESDRLFHQLYKIARMQRLTSPLTELLASLIGVVVLWYGGRQVFVDRSLPPEAFITFLLALFSLIKPIKELSQVNNGIQEGMAAADRLFEILDSASEIQDEDVKPDLPEVAGRVEFKNVSFEYLPSEPVLQKIDLIAQPGEVVALVGSSGAGKSTLVDLIPRFYDPQQGQVLIDGHDVREVNLASLRRRLGIVTQEVILFNDTVRNNIAYGLDDVEQEQIEHAAQVANAHDFIVRMPHGYDTVIGDRGTKLSGGQRQRLSIARAILKNPPILILDEATSALDTESEQLVQEAIDHLVQDRTTFVIAHRLSTIHAADRIYALEAGRIVEQGSHAQLLEAGGVYADLYHLQFRIQER